MKLSLVQQGPVHTSQQHIDPVAQYKQWVEECQAIASHNFDEIEKLIAEDYNGSDAQTNNVLAEIIMFEEFLAGKRENF